MVSDTQSWPRTALLPSAEMTVAFDRAVLVRWLEFNVPFRHKYGCIRDEIGLSNNNRLINNDRVYGQ